MPRPLDDSIVGQYEKFLFYGVPGSGKTFAALTGPPPTYCIVFGGANELKTARSLDFRRKYPELEGQLFFDSTLEPKGKRGNFTEAVAYDQACDMIDEALEQERKGDFQFNTVVVDSATGLRRFAMNKAMAVNYTATKNKTSTALQKLRDNNIIIPGDNDWGSEMSLTMQFIEWLYELPKNVVVVTHEWLEKTRDRGTGETTIHSIKPLFTGNHREYIPSIFDNVWRFTPVQAGRGVQGEAQTVGDELVDAKTRMGGVLPVKIRDVNLRNVLDRFKGVDPKVR